MKPVARIALLILGAALSLPACMLGKDKPQVKVPPGQEKFAPFLFQAPDVPLTDDAGNESLINAIDRQLAVWKNRAKSRQDFYSETLTFFQPRQVNREHVRQSLLALRGILTNEENPRFIDALVRTNFDFYRMSGRTGKGDVLQTAYYHPVIRGSLKRSDKYAYPLYTLPEDLVHIELPPSPFTPNTPAKRNITARVVNNKVLPYFDREQIDGEGRLKNRGLELVYLASDLDRFFLQIQGSGTVLLPNGEQFPVHYAGQNGHPYVGISQRLAEDGFLNRNELSMEAIREFLNEDEVLKDHYLYENPSYVFFKKGSGEPTGGGGAELTPGRSFASDKNLYPDGLPAWVLLHRPTFSEDGKIADWVSATGFMLNQDTGGAIKGPGRVDLYLGSGNWAETTAGHLAYYGEVYYLILKDQSPLLKK